MSKQLPVVSIIVAVFNGAQTLQDCIESIAEQIYTNRELIIIDGGSTDNTLDVINQHLDKIAYFHSEKDNGIYDAWNKGLAHAKGDWICFLGADDYFYDSQVMGKMIERIQFVPPETQIIYGRVALLDFHGKQLKLIGEDWELIKHKFKKIMCIPHPAVMHHKSLFERYGSFDSTFKIAGDYEMLLRCLSDNDAYSVMDITMVAMREGGVSSKPENTIKSFKEMLLAQRMHGHGGFNKLLIVKILREYLRRALWTILGDKYSEILLRFIRGIRAQILTQPK